jgi:uncharacterized protein (DUF305 family)
MSIPKGGPVTGRRAFRAGVTAVLLLAPAAAAGCTGDAAPAAGTGDTPPVIAPGRPGEEARTLSPEEAAEAAGAGDAPTAADFSFLRMMVEHHEQALVMTALAARQAEDDRVGRLAERVAAAQGPEIDAMNGWLTRNAGHAADEGHAGHTGEPMPGMATEEELTELAAARGAEFDALFLELMIRHHEGGVTMAADALAGIGEATVEQLANDIIATQSAEIGRMEELL